MFCKKCGNEVPYGITVCEDCATGKEPKTPPQRPPAAQPRPTVPVPRTPQPVYSSQNPAGGTNGMAIASLVTSLLGFGLVGLILGIIANNQIKASLGRQSGSGMAVAGIIIGCLGTVVVLGSVLYKTLPILSSARSQRAKGECMSNLHSATLGVMQYMQDYDEHMPPANKWSDVLEPYIIGRKVYICPQASNLSCGYSFYDRLSTVSLRSISDWSNTPALFDSNGGWNSALPVEQVAARHNGGYNCGFVDGHVSWMGAGGGMR